MKRFSIFSPMWYTAGGDTGITMNEPLHTNVGANLVFAHQTPIPHPFAASTFFSLFVIHRALGGVGRTGKNISSFTESHAPLVEKQKKITPTDTIIIT